MITLRNKENNQKIGTISEDQLQFLIDQLEEEDNKDQDYYVNRDTLELLKENGADSQLIKMLTEALGSKDDLDIIWAKTE
jgi:hypothetical protein